MSMPSAQPVVVVTGAARGLGRDFARAFAGDDHRVVVADIDTAGAKQVAEAINAEGGQAFAVGVDVTDEASTLAMAAAITGEWGGIDILVNNAGLFGDHVFRPVVDEDIAAWDLVMSINLKGPLLCSRAVVPAMKAAGWGRIVNISSMGAYTNAGVYAISKLALNHLTWCLATELGEFGITVNAVGPGTMDTESSDRQHPDASWRVKRAAATPVRRTGRAEDVYAAIRYFTSDAAEWCTAQTLLVNGGFNVHI
jgi:NAD(P)-dependent dehydrogenase (short-subunit alcohol dehydrogenase family)